MNWFLIYSLAAFIDAIGFITGVLGVGLFVNRIISIFAGSTFAFLFYVNGIGGWGWRTLIGTATEEIPILGDFLPAWTFTVWRVKKADEAIKLQEEDGREAKMERIESIDELAGQMSGQEN